MVDDKRLIQCRADHNQIIFCYDGNNMIKVGAECELCNGTGWAFKKDVVNKIIEGKNNAPKLPKDIH